jgi:DNA polymerase-3 subunit gamma/tau
VAVALYRRYRPESFDELIGQSQVTDPLRAALRQNRVNHAYLFSGPRGCGKTTSARILARCLNCAEGPTDTPCGKCDSCVELSRDGSGSLDVVEIDAASHNGVDDARELRERAGFAPARDRYKIFILDEAHMVTQQGFNALLKIVEEPPEHVKFIFATTEPEKVIGTIRSRTHHYPFRLVPPAVMLDYVAELCVQENVTIEDGVLPLVIRAGGGSVRDTLSLLDQIIAGSDSNIVTRERTNNLLGYTPSELLDECIEAVGRGDAAHAFSAIDRVVQTGNDPRRFVEDVLERLRDLVIVDATGDGAAAVLRGTPADDLVRMNGLAALYGSASLSRAADIVNAALSGMTGTTPPRIHLELMVARLLTELPGAGKSGGTPTSVAAPPPATTVPNAPDTAPASSAPVVANTASTDVSPTETGAEPGTLAEVRDVWPAILEELQAAKGSWVVVNAARPVLLEGDVLTLEFVEQMWVDRFKERPTSGNAVFEDLREAILGALGVRLRFVARVGMASGASPVSAPHATQSSVPASVTPPVTPTTVTAPEAPKPVEPVDSVATIADDAPTTKMDPVESLTVTPAATPSATPPATDPANERRGEAVVREVLGATLIANIDDTTTPVQRTGLSDDAPAIFDVEPDASEGDH